MKWEILPFCLAIGGISVTVRKNETKLVVIPILKRSFAQTVSTKGSRLGIFCPNNKMYGIRKGTPKENSI